MVRAVRHRLDVHHETLAGQFLGRFAGQGLGGHRQEEIQFHRLEGVDAAAPQPLDQPRVPVIVALLSQLADLKPDPSGGERRTRDQEQEEPVHG